jgi:hypothetical protein
VNTRPRHPVDQAHEQARQQHRVGDVADVQLVEHTVFTREAGGDLRERSSVYGKPFNGVRPS